MLNNENYFHRGELIQNWQQANVPKRKCHFGEKIRLEPMKFQHLKKLCKIFDSSPERDWYYMRFGPFKKLKDLQKSIYPFLYKEDPLFFVIFEKDNDDILGFLSYLNIKPKCGSIEIGYIQFSTKIQRTTGATEAIWLLIKHAFELGYRRVEWKCDALNKRSRKAAERLGFKFEGIFRQALLVKGRNRDTAWYSILDKEWGNLKDIFDYWFKHVDCSGSYISLSKLVGKSEDKK